MIENEKTNRRKTKGIFHINIILWFQDNPHMLAGEPTGLEYFEYARGSDSHLIWRFN